MEADKHGIRYEKTDVSEGAVTRSGIILVVVTIVSSFAVLGFFRFLATRATEREPPPPPLARQEPGRQPPEPRLQEKPMADVETLRREESDILTSYGWVDEEKGIVRIPIDEALRIVAERGLPAKAEAPAEAPAAAPAPASPPAKAAPSGGNK